jgi:pSer/pThr/pTyr-binding forkhead associated (FHA) protein
VDDPGVSRQHARFSVAAEGWTLTDLGSSNGTSLNGKDLEPQKAYPLKDGDLIQAGAVVMTFKEGAGP